MNVLARCLLAVALVVAAGCGAQKPEGSDDSRSGSAPPASAAVASVSKYDQGPRAGEAEADEDLAEQGEKLFQLKGCSACHAFGTKSAGPDLAGVSMRRTAAWMENQILHPEVMVKEDPISRQMFGQFALQMPNQGLTQDEARAVIEYFKHQDQEAKEKD